MVWDCFAVISALYQKILKPIAQLIGCPTRLAQVNPTYVMQQGNEPTSQRLKKQASKLK